MDTPQLADAPQILKRHWLDRFASRCEQRLTEAMAARPRESYSRADVVRLMELAHKAVKEDLALEEALR
jgi:hypothetical protein